MAGGAAFKVALWSLRGICRTGAGQVKGERPSPGRMGGYAERRRLVLAFPGQARLRTCGASATRSLG